MILVTEAGARIGAANREIERLSTLIADLRRIAAGDLPTEADLRDALFLDHWAVAARPVHCLVGRVVGHPTLTGPTVRTSDIWAIAPTLGWARTLSRTYALGRPHPSPLSVRPDIDIQH